MFCRSTTHEGLYARLLTIALASALLVLLTIPLFASSSEPWKDRVVGVSDGDTITVMHLGKGEKIRLYGIDCPEKGQGFGKRAKQFTSDLVFGKDVEVKPVTTDRYGRTIAWVYVNGHCLNEELLKVGLAWHYKQYSSDERLAELEDQARRVRAGIWSDPHAVPPWNFRHGKTPLASESPRPATESKTDSKAIVYHGNVKSKKFHTPACRYYDCSNCTAVFHSRSEAIDNGYVPCKVCKP